jgi:hypothetical protein
MVGKLDYSEKPRTPREILSTKIDSAGKTHIPANHKLTPVPSWRIRRRTVGLGGEYSCARETQVIKLI